MQVNATTAMFPGLSVQAALARIAEGVSEPGLGAIGSRHVQLCPQSMGCLTERTCETLAAQYPYMQLRLHANARVLPQRVVCVGDDGTIGLRVAITIGEYCDDEADASADFTFIVGDVGKRHAVLRKRIDAAMKEAVEESLKIVRTVPKAHRKTLGLHLQSALEKQLGNA